MPRHLIRLLAFCALAIPLQLAISAVPVAAETTTDEATFFALTNQTRAAQGVAPLVIDAALTSIARQWSAQMAADGNISHNANLANQVSATGAAWTKVAENVGEGMDAPAIHNAFVNSPHHYTNIVDPALTRVGIGVVASSGIIYVTVDFSQVLPSTPASVTPRVKPTAITRPSAPRPVVARPTADRVSRQGTRPQTAPAPRAVQPAPPPAAPVAVAAPLPPSPRAWAQPPTAPMMRSSVAHDARRGPWTPVPIAAGELFGLASVVMLLRRVAARL